MRPGTILKMSALALLLLMNRDGAGSWNIDEKDRTILKTGSRLAVLNIRNNQSIDRDKAEFLYELTALEWSRTGIFTMIEPEFAREKLRSTDIDQNTDDIDAIRRAGMALYADYVLTGECMKLGRSYILKVKLLDVSSGLTILTVLKSNTDYKKLTMDIADLIKGTEPGKKTEEQREKVKEVTISKGSTLSVMPIEGIDVESKYLKILQQQFTGEIFATGKLRVVESERLDSILSEYELRQAGIKKGRSETGLSETSYLLFATLAKIDDEVLLNVRVVSVITGEVEFSEKTESSSVSGIRKDIPRIVYNLAKKIRSPQG